MDVKDFLNNNDRYAAFIGARLVELRNGYARAEMIVRGDHLNAVGVCQGGALFSLADFTMGALMNSHNNLTLSLEATITYTKSALEGDLVVAEAVETYDHGKIPFCEVKIRNGRGELICAVSGIGYRKEKPLPSAKFHF